MARRKRQFLDDDSSSASGSDGGGPDDPMLDADERAERELFANPYHRSKRRRTNEDATYGVFAESDSDNDEEEQKKRRRRKDMTKAPTFAAASTKVDTSLQTEIEEDEDGRGGDTDVIPDDSSGDDEDEDAPAPARVRDDEDAEDEPKPRFGIGGGGGIGSGFARGGIGIGSGASPAFGTASPAPESTPEPRAGLGLGFGARGGIGSSVQASNDYDDAPAFPKAFGKSGIGSGSGASNAPRKSFLRDETESSKAAAPNLSSTERAHFNKLEGSFGARLMAKMGWQSGTGLGTTGEGIVTPIESKLRPMKMGIAFKGFKEKTEQSKAEARRRGDAGVSDEDEDDNKSKKKKAGKPVDRSAAWKKGSGGGSAGGKRKSRPGKVEHKSYEQILQEAGADGTGQQQQAQVIIDATGAGGPREISSLAEMASWTPSADMRIPEVRHNLRLIVDMSKGELDGLAKEARTVQERRKWIEREDVRLRKKMAEEAQLIARLQNIHLIVDSIHTTAQQVGSAYEPDLEPFTVDFARLSTEFTKEFAAYGLDSVVVAAFAPALRRILAAWQPLQDPESPALTGLLSRWLPALRMTLPEPPQTQLDVYGMSTATKPTVTASDKPMTAYDSFLWNAWLPRVRSALNNDWNPADAAPATRLYEAWHALVPPFVRDNLLDQVVLPKVQKAVAEWTPRANTSLRGIVYPWLPHVGPTRMEELLADARRKVKAGFRAWKVDDAVPVELLAWKDMFPTAEWDNLLLKYVVPKLGATLRTDLTIDPRAQPPLDPLHRTLAWHGHLRPAVLDAILTTEFWPKWLDVLHTWLVHPAANFTQIADWYSVWKKDVFGEKSEAVGAVKEGLGAGLKLMGDAMALGNDRTKLAKPDFGRRSSSSQATSPSGSAAPSPRGSAAAAATKLRGSAARTTEITFRALVEEHAAAHDLLVIPTQRVHELSRMPLLRVSRAVEGRSGLIVYVLDDAVWTASDAGAGENVPWRAITMDEMVVLASQKS